MYIAGETTTITLRAVGEGGKIQRVKTVLVRPPKVKEVPEPPRARVLSFGVSPGVVKAGQLVDVRWRTENASTITLYPGAIDVGSEGSRVFPVDQTMTFSIVVVNDQGSDSRNDSVIVQPPKPEEEPIPQLPKIAKFTISPSRHRGPGEIEIGWRVENADTVFIEPLVGDAPKEGSVVRRVEATTTFRLTARNIDGEESRHETTIITPLPEPEGEVIEPPTINTFSLRPGTISEPADLEVQWRVSGANRVEITPELGEVPSEGSRVIRIGRTTTFQLIATGLGGTEVRHDTIILKPKKEA